MPDTSHYLERELFDLLRNDDEMLRLLIDSVLDGAWYWDLEDPAHEWMNAQFWESLGIDPGSKKHLASEWQSLIHEEGLAEALENFDRHCADESHPYDQVVGYQHADGGTVWVRCRGRAVRGEDGVPVRMLGAHHDVTELVEARNELARVNAQLRAANAELAEVSHVISHDLRAPLNTASGYLAHVLDVAEDPEVRRLVGTAARVLEHGRSLTQRVFELAGLGRLGSGTSRFNLADAAREAVALVKGDLGEGRVEIRDEMEVVADRALLVTLLQNLVGNAIAYREPSRTLEIVVEAEVVAGQYRISVSDNGLGIPEDQLSQVFELFHRVDGAAADGHHGVGLAWCNRIAELHGGGMSVGSALGEGSTFTVYWPVEG